MASKKIVIVQPNMHVGGSQNMAAIYADTLSEMGHRVSRVVLSAPIGNAERDIHFLGYRRSFHAIFALRKKLKTLNPDIVIGFQVQVNCVLSIIKNLLGRNPWRFILRESNLQNYVSHSWFSLLLLKSSYKSSCSIIAQCSDMREHLIRHFQVRPDKISVIHNFVREQSAPREVERQNILLVASTLSYQKDIKGALECWKEQDLREELHIYGENEVRKKELLKYIKDRQIPRVKLEGKVGQVPYFRYKYLLVYSLYEGFSNAVLEALSHGTPVIARRFEGGIGEVINSTNGIIFDQSSGIQLHRVLSKEWCRSQIREDVGRRFCKNRFKEQCQQLLQ